ncbi:hypothetical protein CF319_g5439 [Tilletia indica]|nr:hypothetical protein CF319_g5439 [Tilletia indica]
MVNDLSHLNHTRSLFASPREVSIRSPPATTLSSSLSSIFSDVIILSPPFDSSAPALPSVEEAPVLGADDREETSPGNIHRKSSSKAFLFRRYSNGLLKVVHIFI